MSGRGAGRWVIPALVALALAVRLTGLSWGLPDATPFFSYHPDEFSVAGTVNGMLNAGELNPRFFHYGSAMIYLTGLVCWPLAAAGLLDRWAQGAVTDTIAKPLRIGEAAKLLDVTADQLRNWERNGLIDVPRDPNNGYRLYSAAEIGRLRVIRMLLRAGYSMMAILRMLLQLDRGADPR